MLPDRTYYVLNDDRRARVLDDIRTRECPFEVSVGQKRERRTLDQNARLWVLHTEASRVTGYSPGEMHNFALCHHFGFTEHESIDPLTGELGVVRIPNKRSSTRDIQEFTQFMESTEAWYAEKFGVNLADDKPEVT